MRISLPFFIILFVLSLKEKEEEEINFSHQLHVVEQGIACEGCHAKVKESNRVLDNNLPLKADCSSCHDVEEVEECSTCHPTVESQKPFEVPKRNLIFSHNLHLVGAIHELPLQCQDCHKGIELAHAVGEEHLPIMENCTACHSEKRVKNECEDCHLDVKALRPASHTQDWLHVHRVEGRLSEPTCATCHTAENSCQECHAGRLGEGIGSPLTLGREGLVLDKVHDLNYLFTHPLDAKGKELECATCHEPSKDCTPCHKGAGRPSGHGGPNWFSAEGGLHAEMAKKDFERCTACHDRAGGDPSCLACHSGD